ncbi:hypothetical protein Lser_V15G38526 [Lactuca serriola]
MLNLARRNLTFSLLKTTSVHRLFPRSSSSSPAASDSSFRVSYLIDSCGFPPDKAISASKYLKFKTPDRADSVIALLKNQGFTETQISQLLRKNPTALTCHPEKNLLPKFEFLASIGLSESDIIKLLNGIPNLLGKNLKNYIEPTYSSLRNLLQCKDRTLRAIRKCALVLDADFQANMIPNTQMLHDVGVPGSKIFHLLNYQPRNFLATTEQFKKVVEEIVEMGFDPLKTAFVLGIHTLMSMSKSTREKKMEIYEKWGWSKAQILVAFRSSPVCLMMSEEKIDKVMEFLVSKMGFETSLIAKNSVLVSLSMEKRIIPRCLVYQYCLDNGLMNDKNYCGIGWWLKGTENAFIERLKRYEPEASNALKFYQEKLDHAN